MYFPAVDIRLEMLGEAIALMNELWTGEFVTIRGTYFDAGTRHRTGRGRHLRPRRRHHGREGDPLELSDDDWDEA